MGEVIFTPAALMYFTISCSISFVAGFVLGWYKKRPRSVAEAAQQFKYERSQNPVKEMNQDLKSVRAEEKEILQAKKEIVNQEIR